MRVASINGKKYILVIVDDYSRYTWTLFLRSKDETPEVLKDFLMMIQRNLQAKACSLMKQFGFSLPTQHTSLFQLSDDVNNGHLNGPLKEEVYCCSARRHFQTLIMPDVNTRKALLEGTVPGDKLVSGCQRNKTAMQYLQQRQSTVALSASCAQVMWLRWHDALASEHSQAVNQESYAKSLWILQNNPSDSNVFHNDDGYPA
ncbi:putative ribonuclease H-like domain-containing protein [Tanacetum coccineum]|uniref:Ribonuclease H-like domain-containing protein n=1 Tax=Tanacetum coccineum TaxID=301880 RepID=A0ABQ4WYV2_9ASTR